MKLPSFLSLALIILFAGAGSGCVDISIGSRRLPPPPPPLGVPAPPVQNASDAATAAEIDAAARLDFDPAKLQALTRIAQRQPLSPVVQVHLVNVGYRCIDFDRSKVALLRTVIGNPGFCDATRQAIVSQLNCLSFTPNRQAILREVNDRVTPPKGT